MKRDFVVTSELGIHARPATELIKRASVFKSNIKVTRNGQTIDMKSIMGLMSLGMYKGQKFSLIIEGIDEEEAMETLEEYFLEEGLAKPNE